MVNMKDMTTIEVVGFKEYRKKTTIKAIQMNKPFKVKSKQGWIYGNPGEWLAEGEPGDRYIINNDIFEKTFELVKEPNEFEVKI